MFDIVIRGGSIVDGTGQPAYLGDIGINGDKVVEIGDLSNAQAKEFIEANGMVVSPGFIDTHVHSDAVLLTNPQHPQGLMQGITTEILGQDGLSYAPLSKNNFLEYRRYLKGILGTPPEDMKTDSVSEFRSNYHKKAAINTAYLIAHGALYLEVLGFEDRRMSGDLMTKAKDLVREGMEQGAVGLATGLTYHPHAWSYTEDIVELCKVVNEFDGVYVTHLRDVNVDRAIGGGGIPEALAVGELSSVKVHFSHHRTAEKTAGKVNERMALIDKAKSEGVDVSGDLYPYPTGSTFPMASMPSYVHQGGTQGILDVLSDKDGFKQMSDYFNEINRLSKIIDTESVKSSVDKPVGHTLDLDDTILTYVPGNPEYEGTPVKYVAENMGVSMGEAMCKLLLDSELCIGFWGSPPDNVEIWDQLGKDFLEILSRDDFMVGSDSIHLGKFRHPRAHGTFPRFLGRLRRRYNLISLEKIVNRVTGTPADRFGLNKRGYLKKGFYADVVVFNPETLIDTATYDDPIQYPVGISHVLVNGAIAVSGSKCTGKLNGYSIP